MAKDFLLEIGTEEIPAGFMPAVLLQVEDWAHKYFNEQRISFKRLRAMGTPRRITLIVSEMDEFSEDMSERHKGPAVGIAFDGEGNPTKAAMGFARGKGLDASALVVEDGYVYAETVTKGQAVKTVLPEMILKLLQSLHFPKSMHWGVREERFVRPVRWLVALLDDELIPVEFAGIKSGKVSRGHRFLGQAEIVISNPQAYEDIMAENYVIVDQVKRCAMIEEQLAQCALEHNAVLVKDDELLEEILYLVEYPTALCGSFDESYLQLPSAAVVTPMKDHQRYFPLVDQAGKLLPLFLTVRNGDKAHLDVVQAGNERVLRARLDDAKFFFHEDRKKSLEERRPGLRRIVFQEGLGNLLDKTERLHTLAEVFATLCGVDDIEKAILARAVTLAKTDLTTGMVTEFTELQGIIGKEYALLDGEKEAVAEAIFEQYLPRFAGDCLPQTEAGKILSIVDKVDNIVATFSRGLIPTGSQDPYALRRQTIGILHILMNSPWRLELTPIFRKTAELLQVPQEKMADLLAKLKEFFVLRLKNIYLDRGLPFELVNLVLSRTHMIVSDNEALIAALTENPLYEDEEVVQAYIRIFNMVKDVTYEGVQTDLLTMPEEKELYAQAFKAYADSQAAVSTADYKTVVSLPTGVVNAINQFFEEVMVMDKDERVKQNRLQLLRLTYEIMLPVGSINVLK